MTYAEKADIAAKAVKVLDSVTMKRHKKAAHNYAKLAAQHLYTKEWKDHHNRTQMAKDSSIPDPVTDSRFWLMDIWHGVPVRQAFNRMIERLNKPRYTLKDGEWVKVDRYQHNKVKPLIEMMTQKEAKRLRCHQTMAMAQNVGLGGASFDGGNPYVGLDQFHDAALRNPVIGTGQNAGFGGYNPFNMR